MLKNMKAKIVKTSARAALHMKKHSPEILVAVGIVSIVGGTILACKSTLKLEDIVDDAQEKFEKINKVESDERPDYTPKDAAKDRTIVYAQTAVEIGKLYVIPTILVVGGIGCVIQSHKIMQKRNIALAAAYKTLDDAFKTYRKRVKEEFGEENEEKIRKGINIKDKLGPDGEVVEKAGSFSKENVSQYAKFFDEYNINWTKTPEFNLVFLKAQQRRANDMLHARGHIFLNEVYDMLGMERTQAGALVGWVLGVGDDYIDFGMYRDDEKCHDFVNCLERSILLDFNVDGVIYDMI